MRQPVAARRFIPKRMNFISTIHLTRINAHSSLNAISYVHRRAEVKLAKHGSEPSMGVRSAYATNRPADEAWRKGPQPSHPSTPEETPERRSTGAGPAPTNVPPQYASALRWKPIPSISSLANSFIGSRPNATFRPRPSVSPPSAPAFLRTSRFAAKPILAVKKQICEVFFHSAHFVEQPYKEESS